MAKKDREDGGLDNVGLNPTGRPTRSSGRTRRKKERRLFRGTQWDTSASSGNDNENRNAGGGVPGNDGTVKDSWT